MFTRLSSFMIGFRVSQLPAVDRVISLSIVFARLSLQRLIAQELANYNIDVPLSFLDRRREELTTFGREARLIFGVSRMLLS